MLPLAANMKLLQYENWLFILHLSFLFNKSKYFLNIEFAWFFIDSLYNKMGRHSCNQNQITSYCKKGRQLFKVYGEGSYVF